MIIAETQEEEATVEWVVAAQTRADIRSMPSTALRVGRKVERTATFADPRSGAPPVLSIDLVPPVRGEAGCASWRQNRSCWPQAPNSQQTEPPEQEMATGAPAAAAAEASG